MKRTQSSPFLAIVIASLIAALPAHSADPVPPKLQNVVAQQRPGTMIVDVTYDLIDPDSSSVHIRIEASMNGGSTYDIPTGSAFGDVGLVAPGVAKKIQWNAWDDWAGNYTTNAKVRLIADDTASLKPAPPFPDPNTNLVWIANGGFNMSGTKVYLSQGFWMGKFEVTQAEYQAIRNANPSQFKGSQLPVESVTWGDAVAYCAGLTTRERTANRLPTGWTYRLPTEAEWEYACRAGTSTLYSFGDDPARTHLGSYAWYAGNAGSRTHEVGTRGPNRWGLYDMHGNVSEWCSDWLGSQSFLAITDPKGPLSGDSRVVRGGSIGDNPESLRSAMRGGNTPSARMNWVGFRVVLAPGQ